MINKSVEKQTNVTDIAIIAISCKMPKADNHNEFWDNLLNGKESIQRFTEEELLKAGIDVTKLNKPTYVKAKGVLNNIEYFAADFFGYNAHDAKIMDPQQRMFLESSWEALEAAGYTAEKFEGIIGVYASMSDSTYLQNNLLKNHLLLQNFDWFKARIATSLMTLSTKISYHLNLTGPSINVNTACSSSLVAIATACTSLIDYECDLAIAGASTIAVPQQEGYLHQVEGIESSDGHCRPFDAEASGTVFGNGVGVLVLKRLADALQDRDEIYAVIKGWNVNNDGADKAGFSAPSVNGQANCVAGAFAFADISPESLSYLEAHGTATALGDPIEVAALTKAFQETTNKKQFCAIGSVKSNLGHLDIASGMASIIKVILALKNKQIPATLHYKQPNPNIDFANTPFFVNAELKDWDFGMLPRRAGVNASGIGGTNAFILLEEFTQIKEEFTSRDNQLLILSAKSQTALASMQKNLKQHLASIKTDSDFADVAYTLQNGRAEFNYRSFLVCTKPVDAIKILDNLQDTGLYSRHYDPNCTRKIVFMFSDQANQYAGIASNLYKMEPAFAKLVDEFSNYLDKNAKDYVYAVIINKLPCNFANDRLSHELGHCVVGYSLAKFLFSLGIWPDVLVGLGIGRHIAACLSGSIDLISSLKLITSDSELDSAHLSDIWIKQDQSATTEGTWDTYLSHSNNFADNIHDLLQGGCNTFIEIGSGSALSNLVHAASGNNVQILVQHALPTPDPEISEQSYLLHFLGQLWLWGIKLDWLAFTKHETRYRVALPTYPFERKRCWVEADQFTSVSTQNKLQEFSQQLIERDVFFDNKQPYVAPTNITETEVAKIWQSILGINNISILDSFADLGGNSLNALGLLAKIENKFGVKINLHSLSSVNTIQKMAARIVD